MKAIVYRAYGSPDVLIMRDVPVPTIEDDEALVRVRAASVNSWDWDLVRGRPFLARLEGPRRPRHPILGADIAGQIERTGRNVTQFRPGDEVYGDISASGWGGFAEYVSVSETALSPKPRNLSFAQAAAVPQAAVLALQGLRYRKPTGAGDAVLINGAGGGVGTFAVQLAKHFGADVTGVDRAEKLAMVGSIGADHRIDCAAEDFTKAGDRYDRIVDVVADRSLTEYQRALRPAGVLALIGGSTRVLAQALLLGPLLSRRANASMGLVVHRANADLAYLSELLDDGALVPVIDRQYPLANVAEAFRYFETGAVRGKIVITV